MTDTHTYNEITTQSGALAKTLNLVLNKEVPTDSEDTTYVFSGCGTSFYLAISAARFFQEVTGITAIAVPASEIFLNKKQVFTPSKKYNLFTISRSGTTSEIIKAIKSIEDDTKIRTFAVTCYQDSDMAQLVNYSINLDHIKEKSVVMTQSFTNMLYAIQLFAAKVAGNEKLLEELSKVPSVMPKVLEQVDEMKDLADKTSLKRFIFLGTGIYNGLAKESTLKLKEMTQTECESYSNLEFRHGPISVVDDKTAVVLFATKKIEKFDRTLIKDIQSYGGYTVAIGDLPETDFADKVINLNTTLSDEVRGVLMMPHMQMLAYYRALSIGLNPDQPRNLNQVVKISI
ncbi:SIS domain-containing protein [Pseudalkalibacillus decolorationis]|uniref:SIS domain-containing protein n=1 Tax=Pseudalkalibacillus decolorationis TaxID=163879 RepID=UPI00214796F3|nr:SIS domain-containing protein [Pseudalkalibacillus decolorationis]